LENYQSYFEKNKNSWNRRTPHHVDSDFYNMDAFLEGKSSLNPIELELLGDVSEKSILHLQCHFGQDSISLARMGAKVTGVDLSDVSINKARQICKETNTNADFICCNIYDLPEHLKDKFDIVFTSYGTIGWLPDMDAWAKIISTFLKPKGIFVFVEFHPVVWMFDDNFEKIGYNYFNSGAIIEKESGTYADREADINEEYVGWNHSFGEVITALISNDLGIVSFKEYNYSPYNCFKNTIEFEKGQFRIQHLDDKIPMLYSIKAIKK